jgi:hypothetical protein
MAKEELETWRNASNGKAWVWVHNQIGERQDRQVPAGGKVQLTSVDRQLNQEMAADDSLDLFKNGILVPIRLVEDAEDFADIEDNPNHITEEEVLALFDAPWKTFDKQINEITNRATIERMVSLAEGNEVDAEGESLVDATMRQVKVLRAREADLVGPADRRADEDAGNVQNVNTPDGAAINAVTP